MTHGFGYDRTDGSFDWWTPPEIFDRLGITFDLDPAAPALPHAPWIPAKHRMTIASDGLSQGWSGRVWLNPPYGRDIGKWVGRFIEHGDGVALTFARTDSDWWLALAEHASLVCFLDRRLRFLNGKTGLTGDPAGAPACLTAYGLTSGEALLEADLGLCVWPEPRVRSQMPLVPASPGTLDA